MRPHLPARANRPVGGEPGLDQPKALHSEAQQLVGQLQAALRGLSTDEQLFAPDLHDLRHRLVGCYERLVLGAYDYACAHDLELGLWRHGFYLLIEACRTRLRRQQPGRGLARVFLLSLLLEATGFYQALLHRLLLLGPQPSCLDFARLHTPLLPDDQDKGRQQAQPAASQQRGQRPQQRMQRLEGQLTQSCYRCLIFLGDLARYQSMYGGEDASVAEQAARRYYLQAYSLCSDDGRAFNQLGVLYSSQRATLFDALYCYCRALGATRTLSNAADNIRGCLDRTRAHAAALQGPMDLGTCPVEQLLQHFCTGFAALHQALFARAEVVEANRQVAGVVGGWACMLDRLLGPSMSGLDGSLLAKAQVVNMAMAHHLAHGPGQGANSTEGLGLVQRLGLLMFKHTAMAMIRALALQGTGQDLHGGCERASRVLLPALVVFGDWMLCQLDASLSQKDSPQPLLLPAAISELDSAGAEEQPFWVVMALLANQLTAQATPQALALADTMAAHWLARALQQTRPAPSDQADTWTPALGEDVALRGFAPLAPLHTMLAFPSAGHEGCSTLHGAQAEAHRTARLLAFMKTAAALPGVVAAMAVDPQQGGYHTTVAEDLAGATLEQAIDSWRTDEERRRKGEVMRAMAQQRLQTEVQALEGQVLRQRSGAQPYALALYAIPDVGCFVSNLRGIKEIVGLQRYVVLVPLVALAGLDELKKGTGRANRQAREATRWLEDRFQKGDPWVRAQAREEAMGPTSAQDPVAELPQNGPEARLLHCARYFAHHTQQPSQEGSPAVVVLTEQVAELRGHAQACHVAIDTVDRFLRLARQNARLLY